MLAMTVDGVLAASDGAKVDVVVVDDGCTDGCIEPVARLRDGRVRIVEGGGLGVARARNFGAAHVDAEILVFLDAHCTVPAGWLHALATSLDDPSVGLLGPAFTRLTSPTPRGCGMRWAGFDLEPCWFTAPDTAGAYPVPLTIGASGLPARDVRGARALRRAVHPLGVRGRRDLPPHLDRGPHGHRASRHHGRPSLPRGTGQLRGP